VSALELLRAPARQSSALTETAHRPWPLPSGSWLMGQTWEDLFFAHWRVAAAAVRELVPAGLTVDEHDGSAWLGVTLFELTGLRLRGTLPLPVVSSFPVLNVRTYVTAAGKPGIWLFSLDTPSLVAGEVARRVHKQPSFHARISLERDDGRILGSAARREGLRPFVFEGSYRPDGDPSEPEPGTLEHFLAERYCVYASDESGLYRGEIHRLPWRIRPAEASIELNTMPPDGLELQGEPLCHLAERQDVVIWPLEQISGK
jgi:uncharacterized protein